ncbi:MAG: sensor histidine kinase [Pararhodobacter sp.]|nr:sensor histidine kinase [Pararhodobacter sp.]
MPSDSTHSGAPPLPARNPAAAGTGSRTTRRIWQATLSGMMVLALGLGLWGYGQAKEAALRLLEARAQNTLNLAVAALNGQLRRFDRLPAMIAQSPEIRALMLDAGNPEHVLQTNIHLRDLNTQLQASDIYVMALDGTTIAASNFDLPHSFMGGNFAFRPYFHDALVRGVGRFYALGTTSLVRGYYFGAPILIDDAAAGVLVVKVDLDAIEQSWRGSDYEVIVTDPEDIIFMSSHPDWTFAATRPLDDARRARTLTTRRYARETLRVLPMTPVTATGGQTLWRITGQDTAHEYLLLSEQMPDADWTVHVLIDTAGARQQALGVILLGGLAAGLALLGAVIVAQRRARLAERLALHARAQAEREGRVQARTAELARVNRQLEAEITERRATEAALRSTQADLVQAAKLAALGQMSAALSHEFNQPLGAARNYAENAELLIDRGRLDEARGNIGRILTLIDRLGAISRHLRNFARKPNARLEAVPLHEAVTATREILDWRLRAQGITLSVDLKGPAHAPEGRGQGARHIRDSGDGALRVRAGPVRLQQVLVNILTNAMDALEGQIDGHIALTARTDGAQAVITIADNGPGIAPGLLGRIFDPFFTSKQVGKGLGLGLSISYNIVHDFGGTLGASNAAAGGAVFTLTLPLAAEPAAAA